MAIAESGHKLRPGKDLIARLMLETFAYGVTQEQLLILTSADVEHCKNDLEELLADGVLITAKVGDLKLIFHRRHAGKVEAIRQRARSSNR